MDIKVCTYNCCSFKKNIDIIRSLTECNYDFIFLQETYIVEDRLGDIDFISEEYTGLGVPATYSEKCLESNAGRCEGGLVCIWRKDLPFTITVLAQEKFLIAIQVTLGDLKIILINVYMNSVTWEAKSMDEYLYRLQSLEYILSNNVFNSVYFLGDFNADPFMGRAWNQLVNFCDLNSLSCIDYNIMDSNTFTFIPYSNSYTKWLDHILGSNNANTIMDKIDVLHDLIGSDHLPMVGNIHVMNSDLHSQNIVVNEGPMDEYFIPWSKLCIEDYNEICYAIIDKLRETFSNEAVHCCELGCQHAHHISQIDIIYREFSTTIQETLNMFEKPAIRKNKFKIIPGWNRNVKEIYNKYRSEYKKWLACGKQRDCEEYYNMTQSRKEFKDKLSQTKKNEAEEKSISIQEKFNSRDMKSFWSDIKKQQNKLKSSHIIDGTNKVEEIIHVFRKKFFTEEIEYQKSEENQLLNRLKKSWAQSRKFQIAISPERLKIYIHKLKTGVGHDGIHSHLLKFATYDLLCYVSQFMNMCFNHCYIPNDLLKGDIKPILKNVKGDVTDSSNYRPIMISSCFLKLFEMHILSILEEKVSFNFRQLGFSSGLSTNDSCFLLKETIYPYIKNGGKAYAAFIDLSKAFDKVDHFILGNILLDRNISPDIVLIIMNYLRNQRARVLWKNKHGMYNDVNYGVRQGGILSPFLFKLYIDNVINHISDMNVGCRQHTLRINILAYADDIVLLSDTKSNLEQIVKKFEDSISTLKLKINTSKSKCMIFDLRNGNVNIDKILEYEVVDYYNYLGHIISSNLSDKGDVEKRLMTFYKQFNSIFRKFKGINTDALMFLFKSYCTPDYGLQQWNTLKTFSMSVFKTFEIAFANALKKIAKCPTYISNHSLAKHFNIFLLKHHVYFTQARYFKSFNKKNSVVFILNRPLFAIGKTFKSFISSFKQTYLISFLEYPLDIIAARILWTQNHEPTSGVPVQT